MSGNIGYDGSPSNNYGNTSSGTGGTANVDLSPPPATASQIDKFNYNTAVASTVQHLDSSFNATYFANNPNATNPYSQYDTIQIFTLSDSAYNNIPNSGNKYEISGYSTMTALNGKKYADPIYKVYNNAYTEFENAKTAAANTAATTPSSSNTHLDNSSVNVSGTITDAAKAATDAAAAVASDPTALNIAAANAAAAAANAAATTSAISAATSNYNNAAANAGAASAAASAAAAAYSAAAANEKLAEEAETKALAAEAKAIALKNAALIQQQKEFNASIAYEPPAYGEGEDPYNLSVKYDTDEDPYNYDSPSEYRGSNSDLPITYTPTTETKKPKTGGVEDEPYGKGEKNKDNWTITYEWMTPPLPELTFPNYPFTASQIIVEDMIDGSADAWMAGGALYDSPRAGDVYFNETGDMNTVRFLGLSDKNYNTHLDRKLQGMANVYKILGVHAGDGDMHGDNAMAKLYQSHTADVLSKIAASNKAVEEAKAAVLAQKAAEDARISAANASASAANAAANAAAVLQAAAAALEAAKVPVASTSPVQHAVDTFTPASTAKPASTAPVATAPAKTVNPATTLTYAAAPTVTPTVTSTVTLAAANVAPAKVATVATPTSTPVAGDKTFAAINATIEKAGVDISAAATKAANTIGNAIAKVFGW